MIFKKLIKNVFFSFRMLTSGVRQLPKFIIIGVQKGGTTSLTYYLKQHPQVYLPIKKEVHFFDLNFKKGLSWYKAYFPILSNKIPGEATPYYIFHPHVAKRIKQTIPNAKFIVLLREPVSRAFSQYRKETSEKHDNIKTFEEAFEAEKERVENEEKKMIKDEDYYSYAHQRYTYFSRGLYHKQIQNWLQYFNMEQFLFLKSEDFFSNPKKELKKV